MEKLHVPLSKKKQDVMWPTRTPPPPSQKDPTERPNPRASPGVQMVSQKQRSQEGVSNSWTAIIICKVVTTGLYFGTFLSVPGFQRSVGIQEASADRCDTQTIQLRE